MKIVSAKVNIKIQMFTDGGIWLPCGYACLQNMHTYFLYKFSHDLVHMAVSAVSKGTYSDFIFKPTEHVSLQTKVKIACISLINNVE